MTLSDQSFSLYDVVDWRTIYNIFTERRALLASWCRTIELAVIERSLDTEIYAGFQQMRYLAPVLPRYQKMSLITNSIWVFGQQGEQDPPMDGLNGVVLQNDDQLIKEWFLVVNHPKYARALVAQETSKPGTPHSKRVFRGLLTSDQAQVARFATLLKERVSTLKEV